MRHFWERICEEMWLCTSFQLQGMKRYEYELPVPKSLKTCPKYLIMQAMPCSTGRLHSASPPISWGPKEIGQGKFRLKPIFWRKLVVGCNWIAKRAESGMVEVPKEYVTAGIHKWYAMCASSREFFDWDMRVATWWDLKEDSLPEPISFHLVLAILLASYGLLKGQADVFLWHNC